MVTTAAATAAAAALASPCPPGQPAKLSEERTADKTQADPAAQQGRPPGLEPGLPLPPGRQTVEAPAAGKVAGA